MPENLRRFLPALLLIGLTSGGLLLSDLGSRRDGEIASQAGDSKRKTYQIALACYMPEPSRDACEAGLFDGLKALGLVEGDNLKVLRAHAQGEAANIPSILRNFDNSPVDALVTFSTPVLQGALATVRNKPVVFTYCVDPIKAGAGESFTNHRPGFTGVGSLPPIGESIQIMQEALPAIRSLGVIYNDGEANSQRIISLLREVCQKQGLRLVEKTAMNPNEVIPAAQALVTERVDAIYIPNDNTAAQAFDGIVFTATKAGIPTISADPDDLGRGVLMGVGAGFYYSGKAAAEPLAEVLRGKSPSDIPIRNVSVSLARVDLGVAKTLGISLPVSFLARLPEADKISSPVVK